MESGNLFSDNLPVVPDEKIEERYFSATSIHAILLRTLFNSNNRYVLILPYFQEYSMIHYRRRTLWEIKIPALVFGLFLSLMAFTLPAEAQTSKPCPPSSTIPCIEATIFNCTNTTVLVSFKLCCNGVQVISDYVAVPAVACPAVAATPNFSPCAIIGIYNIISAGRVSGYEWNANQCSLTITNL